MLIVFTSDLHGNETQYVKLVQLANAINAHSVIIGGDLAPKGLPSNIFIQTQANFLKQRLPELTKDLKSNLYVIMGNDDCKVNESLIEKKILIHGRFKFNDDFDIVGYPYVPITPFAIKDWEKYDVELLNGKLNGIKSTTDGWNRFTFSEKIKQKSSIQKDLEKRIYTKNPEKTIYVMHTPPYNTHLDLAVKNELYMHHVGSIALRKFIEKHQPYLTLHGHIHETVYLSGIFKENIGKTICISSGNDNKQNTLAAVVFDLYHPEKARRVIV